MYIHTWLKSSETHFKSNHCLQTSCSNAPKELFNKKLQSKSINPLSNVMKVLVLLYNFLRFLVVCSVSEVCSVHRVLILIMFAPSLTGDWGLERMVTLLTSQHSLLSIFCPTLIGSQAMMRRPRVSGEYFDKF